MPIAIHLATMAILAVAQEQAGSYAGGTVVLLLATTHAVRYYGMAATS